MGPIFEVRPNVDLRAAREDVQGGDALDCSTSKSDDGAESALRSACRGRFLRTGCEDSTFFNLNFQPVIPFELTADWSMIFRTIIPIDSVPSTKGLSCRLSTEVHRRVALSQEMMSAGNNRHL